MKHWLSKDKQAKLIGELIALDMPIETATRFAELPDDMVEVDIDLSAHAQCIMEFRDRLNGGEKSAAKNVQIGLACTLAIMTEAMERGLGENDFPISLQVIKEDLSNRGLEVQ